MRENSPTYIKENKDKISNGSVAIKLILSWFNYLKKKQQQKEKKKNNTKLITSVNEKQINEYHYW